jgi:hypothetical protein
VKEHLPRRFSIAVYIGLCSSPLTGRPSDRKSDVEVADARGHNAVITHQLQGFSQSELRSEGTQQQEH